VAKAFFDAAHSLSNLAFVRDVAEPRSGISSGGADFFDDSAGRLAVKDRDLSAIRCQAKTGRAAKAHCAAGDKGYGSV
jgi:hypothetical protein